MIGTLTLTVLLISPSLSAEWVATHGALTVALDPRHDTILMKHMVAWGHHHLLSSIKILQANGTPLLIIIREIPFLTFIHKVFCIVPIVQIQSPCHSLCHGVIDFLLKLLQGPLLRFWGQFGVVLPCSVVVEVYKWHSTQAWKTTIVRGRRSIYKEEIN